MKIAPLTASAPIRLTDAELGEALAQLFSQPTAWHEVGGKGADDDNGGAPAALAARIEGLIQAAGLSPAGSRTSAHANGTAAIHVPALTPPLEAAPIVSNAPLQGRPRPAPR